RPSLVRKKKKAAGEVLTARADAQGCRLTGLGSSRSPQRPRAFSKRPSGQVIVARREFQKERTACGAAGSSGAPLEQNSARSRSRGPYRKQASAGPAPPRRSVCAPAAMSHQLVPQTVCAKEARYEQHIELRFSPSQGRLPSTARVA